MARRTDPTTSGVDERAIAEFYKAHAITIYVGSAPGGGYAVYAQTLARHLPRHLPGEQAPMPHPPAVRNHSAYHSAQPFRRAPISKR